MMADSDFDGDRCVVLPKNYLQSPQAVSEIYEEDLAKAATNFDVDSWRPSFFRGNLIAVLTWAVPSIWTVCY